MKNYYYIGVMVEDGIRLVTAIHNATRTVEWQTSEKPLPLSLTVAENTIEGLLMNGVGAMLIKSRIEIEQNFGGGSASKPGIVGQTVYSLIASCDRELWIKGTYTTEEAARAAMEADYTSVLTENGDCEIDGNGKIADTDANAMNEMSAWANGRTDLDWQVAKSTIRN